MFRDDDYPHDLYRLYDKAGALLYIGISNNATRRMSQHAKDKAWWPDVSEIQLERFKTRSDAAHAEREAIQIEAPTYNVVHNGENGGPPPTPSATYENMWRFRSRPLRPDSYEHVKPIHLYWEPNWSSISDNYPPDEADEWEVWQVWTDALRRNGYDLENVKITWCVYEAAENAPFYEDYLNFLHRYTWPVHATTGEPIEWTRCPVMDLGHSRHKWNKAGFIQELTGWKPSPLQQTMNVVMIEQMIGVREYRVPDEDGWLRAQFGGVRR